jgi:3-isopropylmalate/(R)-2-methylmalate dehydratase large subunit
MNCAARAVTILDLLYAVTTGETWLTVGATVRYDLAGRLRRGVSAMDVFLAMAGSLGSHAGQHLEYGGEGLAGMSIAQRRTIATMSTELNADFATFEADERLLDHVRDRTDETFEPVAPDADAAYARRATIDLGGIETMVAMPDAVLGNTVPVAQASGQPIDQAFIGSCANGSLSDIAEAAEILDGRKVAPGVRLIVTPASQAIYRAALDAGYLKILAEAGAIVTNSSCGACAGGHLGVLGPGETCITSSTRNFKGRMGDASARIFMGSPATVAASAAAGAIADPREMLQ